MGDQQKLQFLDLVAQYRTIKPEVDAAIEKVVSSGGFILGRTVEEFEAGVAAYVGVRHAVGVNSGTDALYLALKAAGVRAGDEVITTPFTFIATAEVVTWVPATPVFVDICPDTLNIDPARIEAAITKKTRAIMPVHIYGQAADMDEIMAIAKRHDLAVIEDCAQSLGAAYRGRQTGSIGRIAGLSFYPSKNLGAYGDGGMILTDDDAAARECRMLRQHGSEKTYHHVKIGVNSRLDALQAAVLAVKLKYLDRWNRSRREKAAHYDARFAGVGDIVTPEVRGYNDMIYHQYTLRTARRDAMVEHLRQHQVPCAVHYPIPLHLQPAFESLGKRQGSFPVAEDAASRVFSLPIYPEITGEQQDRVADAVAGFFK
ncbi:MAG: DegT/DnrJ/EryC1/StrS family aminotransferase [Candidatus Edwardsbacteria bacterium]|jgi:dTDP-4-amino-4,6-dideoxygalactose transaminase|nr:DegT/DnrJ/EryC1/StrS family aminotransferase [Candidatus Edwardsbacteria bacterium]